MPYQDALYQEWDYSALNGKLTRQTILYSNNRTTYWYKYRLLNSAMPFPVHHYINAIGVASAPSEMTSLVMYLPNPDADDLEIAAGLVQLTTRFPKMFTQHWTFPRNDPYGPVPDGGAGIVASPLNIMAVDQQTGTPVIALWSADWLNEFLTRYTGTDGVVYTQLHLPWRVGRTGDWTPDWAAIAAYYNVPDESHRIIEQLRGWGYAFKTMYEGTFTGQAYARAYQAEPALLVPFGGGAVPLSSVGDKWGWHG